MSLFGLAAQDNRAEDVIRFAFSECVFYASDLFWGF